MATDFSLPVFVITDVTISGTPYKLPVFQTGKTVKMKLAETPYTEYTGVEDGTTGIYKFTDIPDGKYHKLVNGVQSGTFGVTNGRFIADDSLPYAKLAGGNTLTGHQDIETATVNEAYMDDAAAPYTTNTPTYDSSLVWKKWVDDTYASLAGGNTFTGNQVMGNQLRVVQAANLVMPYIDAASPWLVYGPQSSNSIVWSGWLEARLASLVLIPYQESVNKRRCIPGGNIEANKVYPTPLECSTSFASPSATNQCCVEISGTGASSQYLKFPVTTLRDYVHWTAPGKHIKVVMSDLAANTKTCTFQNLTIFFGAIDYTVDREYANMTFIDCDIYCYKNTTFNNCRLIRCRIIHASTYQAKLKGSTICELTGFNNDYDKSLLTSGYEPSGAYLIYGESVPSDPSTLEIGGT